jgi:hypothetical protein
VHTVGEHSQLSFYDLHVANESSVVFLVVTMGARTATEKSVRNPFFGSV